jgi:hypothetical protein
LSGRQTFFHHGADAETREDVDKKQSNALEKFVGGQHLVCLWKYALWLSWPDPFESDLQFWSAGNNELVALTNGASPQGQAELSMLPIMRASSLGLLDPVSRRVTRLIGLERLLTICSVLRLNPSSRCSSRTIRSTSTAADPGNRRRYSTRRLRLGRSSR